MGVSLGALLVLGYVVCSYANRTPVMPPDEVREKLKVLDALNPSPCPAGWADAYTAFHKKALATSDAKMIVAVPNLSGLADRVIGIVTVCMVGMLTDRAFQVGHRDPLVPLQSIFDMPHINWIRPPDEPWLLEPLKHDAKQRSYNASVQPMYTAINTIDDWKLQDKFLRQKLTDLLSDSRTVLIAMNRGKTIRMFENTHHRAQLAAYQLTPETAFGCIARYLFQPKPEVFSHMGDLLGRLADAKGQLVIGIQIRAGDTYLNKADHGIDINQFHAFFDCAKQIEAFAEQGEAKWLVVTDSMPLRHQILKIYGDKVITSLHTPIEHSAKEMSVCKDSNCVVSSEGFKAAAAEWWMYSYARYHVISQYSGYGRSAAMMSFRKNSIYTVPYKQMSKTIMCSNTSFTELGDLPYEWSGI